MLIAWIHFNTLFNAGKTCKEGFINLLTITVSFSKATCEHFGDVHH